MHLNNQWYISASFVVMLFLQNFKQSRNVEMEDESDMLN